MELPAAAAAAVRRMLADQPGRQAFWGAWAAALLICARHRVPFLGALIIAELAGHTAALAYRAAADVHRIAEGIRGGNGR